jgi:Cyclic nucleotide-binding domain
VELPPVTAPGYVGEVGLLHGIPRTATVRTRQECTLLRIDGQDFLSALQDSRPAPRWCRWPESGCPHPDPRPSASARHVRVKPAAAGGGAGPGCGR